ncbi:lipopolysaccharide assembly protein LapA domain-containing protein [Alteromonas aestuariivivens]|uniref:lipopolysaccharide assembly protein LapA domain-containing protein n=1 Tax=Alteromonas aestuariivivens TaxID=1938339 RepID=UPI001FE8F331|nr:LapA family protein [Alteromonas aestuariivivens]
MTKVSVLKGIISLLVIVLLLAVAFAIGSQNDAVITVNYLLAQTQIRISTLIAITLSIGVVIGLLIMLASWLSLRVQLLAARAKLKKFNKEN